MEATKRQKIHNALCTGIAYAAKGFLTLMTVAFALMFLVCATQLFKTPGIAIIGALGFGGCALILWDVRKDIVTR